VTIIGGGLCGKAASLQLAQAGLRVVCIEPKEPLRPPPVGESLDWSAPALLSDLGLPMEDLIGARMATWKRHVTMKLRSGDSEHYIPAPWLAGKPFHIELRTLHVDRLRLDEELLKRTLDGGVTIIRDTVIRVERNGQRISAVHTAGTRFSSSWFIDASGFATSLLAREFRLPAIQFGPAKVAVWAYFAVSESVEGTTLYMEPLSTKYLEWIWEIPINPQIISVGYATTGAAMKVQREQGLGVEDIFRQQLAKYPRFAPLLEAGPLEPCNVTSFQSRVYDGVAGPNWFIAGEAASMVDPITANGVTAALRHAAEASALILKYRKRDRLPLRATGSYNRRIVQIAKFFNMGIEKILYEPAVRNRIGARHSGTVYTSPAWSMNVVYARLNPMGILSTFLLGSVLWFFRASAWVFAEWCKRMATVGDTPA
jgi:menaquinone-9 beta-reductase